MSNALSANKWTNKSLYRLVWPLVVEQLLAVTIGMADTVMVSALGESAVSGVSLVDSINILLITAMTAIATGGAVVASQYLGQRDRDNACLAAKQLVYAITAFSLITMILVLFISKQILQLVYGTLEPDVMANAKIYFWLSAISYPFIALYNAGSALFRSMGNSRIGMLTSVLVNVIHIGGNFVLIFWMNLGVAGAALSSLLSRVVAAYILIRLLLKVDVGPISLFGLFQFSFSKRHTKQILQIGIPNGLETSLFQIGKLMVARMVSTFGTSAIAANAIAGAISTFATLPGQAFGLALLTVVGQCVGAKNYAAARVNTKKLMITATLIISALCLFIFLLRMPLLHLFNLSEEALYIGERCLTLFCITAPLLWALSFAFPNALRAAGDAKFTMAASLFSMWTFRIGIAWLLSMYFDLGVIGVWYAMIFDWIVRSIFFTLRWISGKWENKGIV